MTENTDIRRKRLIHRSHYRGFREADLLIGGFASEAVPTMTEDELDAFEALINLNDHDIFGWITGRESPPADIQGPVFDRLRKFNIAGKIMGARPSSQT